MRKSIFASLWNRSAAFLLVGALLLLLLTGNLSTALAVGNGTAAGQAKAPGGAATLAGSPSIDVTAPYADDDNADNSLLIEWGENGVDFALGSWSSAGHTPSPYSYSITGLDNAKGYQVRVTFSDGDGGTSLVQVLTGLRSYNSLLHNGVATGSSKHGGGNWGLADAGSKYGEFTCMTCHGPVTTNIKRVREAVVAPNFPTDAFPGSAVVLTDTRNSSADFGDDTRALPNTSTNVCEVCHSATAYHRYDATTNTGGTGHYNTLDCISCHKHRTAFRASCSGCHGNSSSGAIWPDDSTVHVGNDDPSGRHAKHMEILADKALGLTLAALLADAATETKQKQLCEYCHAANTNDSDHGGATPADVFVDSDAVRHAKTTWGAADNDALYNSGTDTCSNIDCHNSKLTTDATYGWYDAGTSACGLCHAADPATGAHTAHIGAAYGPLLGVKCGDCHEANDYNTNMTGISSHMDGDVDFTGGVLLVAATACNNCHGGATPAATAKANWSTASSVSCESCHGANAAATRNADGSGVTAPVRTTNYASKGHGRPGGTLPPNKACVDCHDASVAHISGALDDANRIKTIATKNYDTGGQANDWCNGCHTAAMPLHYGNGRTAGGTSDDGLLCNQCHDPHGNSGYDAMVAATIGDAGRSIAAFTDRTARGDYANASFDGVCQVCHELESAGQVDYFNRTENEAHYAGNCISCHKHDGTEAFKPSGCNGCHGDAVIGNFWPDGTTRVGSGADRDALHSIHVDPIGQNIAAADDATWAAMNATDKLNHKNSTCSYCHPDPGGTNASGGSHDSNTTGSPTEVADLHKDGFNPATSYTNLQGGADTTGSYNPTIKRCSTVTCHSNGEFTWTWYDDVLAPGPISDLVAVSGSEPGSVDLTWSAPYNDGSEGPNAYHYRVKQGGAAISSNALYDSASDAGGPPTVTRRGNSNSMTVQGLTPGGTYHFAVKTADEAYNWSAVSNSVSAVAKIDTLAPIFWGVGSAVVDDEPGTITLNWEAARDHSLPVTYKIWYSVGSIDYGLAPNATTQGTSFRVTGLPTGVLYHFAVRATDAVGNTDVNSTLVQQLAKTPPTLAKTSVSYYTNGSTALQTGSYGTAGSGGLTTLKWEAPAYATDTNVVGYSFSLRCRNSNENTAATTTLELGYTTGGTWNNFPTPLLITQDISPISNRIYTYNFSAGGMVPGGSKLALRLIKTVGAVTVSYGSATNRGDFSALEQPYNHLPSAVAYSPQPSGSGIVSIAWTASSDSDGHSVHYDVYGSDDGGTSWDYLIASDLPAATTSVVWDTAAAGIALSAANGNVKVKVYASDGYQSGDGSGATATETISNAWTVNNSIDSIAPAAITDLVAETRPKTGSVYLHWTAPGDDSNAPARASEYDIRWSTADIGNDTQYDAATTVFGEPQPDFAGTPQSFEVLGLTPGTTYYFAMKTADEKPNWSALSNSATANGGLKCGVCHGTPPDDAATSGNHIAHGYTVSDCAKCHGDVANFSTTKHQDGVLSLGFGRDASGNPLAPVAATITGTNSENVAYWQNGVKIYEDTNGAGGINETAWAGSDKVDNGTCAGFTSVNASGCHGASSPSWDAAATLTCAACHGLTGRVGGNDLYGRPYDDSTLAVDAAPPIDNHWFAGNPGDPIDQRRYVGQHEKHLNASYRFAKASSCRLCHKDNNHGDGIIDINFDDSGAGASTLWTPYDDGGTPGNNTDDSIGTCGSTSDLACHGAATTPAWDSAVDLKCNSCHGFSDSAPSHVTDPTGAGFVDDGDGNCEYCHPGGHPKGAEAGTVVIPNNIFVGINYASGGIHLKTNIGGRGAVTSEAEICWGCHDANSISEWGVNNNAETGSSPYNYGSVTSSNWTSASWSSAVANFAYKTGSIQSTHTTSPDGTSVVAWNAGLGPDGAYQETVDAVGNIRCSNCHDVHGRNLADGDTSSGTPYLRGTWKGNPYEEDGAPWNKSYKQFTVPSTKPSYQSGNVGYGAIPRGGQQYGELGGYYVDENNVVPGTGANATPTEAKYPTQGWNMANSAGLCALCHGEDVDELDQTTGENLWLGTNGHSNGVLGGTGQYAVNIFDYTHGRPTPISPPGGENNNPNDRLFDMGARDACRVAADDTNPVGYRGSEAGAYTFTPRTDGPANRADGESFDCGAFDWGVTVDATTTEKGYHQFSCSKCHNPHASRLPKLMITNCLDVRHNSWDDAKDTQTWNTRAEATDKNKQAAYFVSAQNCHRRDSSRSTETLKGGWNKVTPW